jgi:hypothetical protein
MKKIFVAGASSEAGEVAAAMSLLRPAGWEITADWPEMQRNEPKFLSPRHCEQIGTTLINAMLRADIFWLLLSKEKSEGAATEFGFYLGAFYRESKGGIIVSGDATTLGRLYPYAMGSKGKLFAEHADALSYLIGMT